MTASNTYGRQVILTLTNKSGGGVIAGDVVVIDSANNDAFTTSTAGAVTIGVGIAQETIASNGTGRILISGYAALVNVDASVTRGHFGKTFTVAKQATDAGASRVVGAFCQFLTGGTTPDAVLFGMPDGSTGGAGSPGTPALTLSTTNSAGAASTLVATDATIAAFDATVPVTQALGDSAAAGAAGVAARRDHKHGMPAASSIAGYEFDYVAFTAPVSITATSDGTANTVVTANAVTYDGSTVIFIEFFAPYMSTGATAGNNIVVQINEGATVKGYIWGERTPAGIASGMNVGVFGRLRLTPTNAAHTYSARAWLVAGTTGSVGAGAGGSDYVNGYIRQIRAT